ncbi:MAG: ABC transporter permease [Hyphomicrobiaceae bacterium]|nr:ABC transporter permease [Hyphomicrobiaceae bacterium]
MAPKLAFRNLFHDRLSLIVTLTGIVFSVVLVAVQCGLYLGSEQTIARVIDQTDADIWIVPLGTQSFDDPSIMPGQEKYAALSVPGVASVENLLVGFSKWRKPEGGSTTILLVGSDWNTGGLAPWNLVDGTLDDLSAPFTVAVDKSYFNDLGIKKLDDTAEINETKVRVAAVSTEIRSFTTLPYVFTKRETALALLDASASEASYTLVKVAPGADVETVRADLAKRLPDAEVMRTAGFRKRSLDYWLFQTGAGAALIAGALLGLIVGVVIVAQTLYSSTKDHLNEFATLRALGASGSYIHQVILLQAMISAVIGYTIGMLLSLLVIWSSRGSTLNIVMTPGLAGFLFAVTIGMCAIAAVSAIFKVTRIDPAGVFSR